MCGFITLALSAYGITHLRRKYECLPSDDPHDTKLVQYARMFGLLFGLNLFLPLVCGMLAPMLGAGFGVFSAVMFFFFACIVSVGSLMFLALLLIGPIVLFSPQAAAAFDGFFDQLRELAEALCARTKLCACKVFKSLTPACVSDKCCTVTKEDMIKKATEMIELAKEKAIELQQWAMTEGIVVAKKKSQEFSTCVVEKSQKAVETAKSCSTWAQQIGAQGVIAHVNTSLSAFEQQRSEKRLNELRVSYDSELEAAVAATKAGDEAAADKARRRAVNLNAQLKTIDIELAAAAKKDGPKQTSPTSLPETLLSATQTSIRIAHHACEYHLTGFLLNASEGVKTAAVRISEEPKAEEPKVVEKIVEKIVEKKVVEEKVVEKIVEVEKVVEKVVEKIVPVEKVVEKIVEVEKVVEKVVEKIVEVEKKVPVVEKKTQTENVESKTEETQTKVELCGDGEQTPVTDIGSDTEVLERSVSDAPSREESSDLVPVRAASAVPVVASVSAPVVAPTPTVQYQ